MRRMNALPSMLGIVRSHRETTQIRFHTIKIGATP